MTSSPARLRRAAGNRPFLWAAAVVFIVPLVFALFTNHVWEDYYITFRASKNLAEGHGLVYQIGERVHSFTSPLGVLLPSLFYFVTQSDAAALWILRVVCCGALAGSVILLWQMLEERGGSVRFRWLVTLLVIAESKTLDFTINGMETAFMLLFVTALLRRLLCPTTPSAFAVGTVLAALMWTRPDAFVIAGLIMVASLSFIGRPRARWSETACFYLAAAGWAAVFYGPWLAWAWWYYGSPVPHTIIAKSGLAPGHLDWTVIWNGPLKYLTGASQLEGLLNPSYFFLGGWPAWLLQWEHLLAILAGIVWVIPRIHITARTASLALFLGSIYVQAIPIAPWYLPYWYMLAALSLAGAVDAVLGSPFLQGRLRLIVRSTLGAALVLQFAVVGLSAWQFRQQQRIIEDSGRHLIGVWLRTHAQPGDTVFLEPLGYIGYFSQLHMLDYPGLCAPAVVAARRGPKEPTFAALIQRLEPDWLVLRPPVVAGRSMKESKALDKFELVRVWDARAKLDEISLLPGRALLEFDAVFLLYRREQLQ